MRLPNQIKIGPYTYKVLYPYAFGDHADCRGTIDYQENVIRLEHSGLDKEYCMPRIWQTFCHEIVHGVLDHCQIELEERQVDLLGSTVLQVLLDNGWLEIDEE